MTHVGSGFVAGSVILLAPRVAGVWLRMGFKFSTTAYLTVLRLRRLWWIHDHSIRDHPEEYALSYCGESFIQVV